MAALYQVGSYAEAKILLENDYMTRAAMGSFIPYGESQAYIIESITLKASDDIEIYARGRTDNSIISSAMRNQAQWYNWLGTTKILVWI